MYSKEVHGRSAESWERSLNHNFTKEMVDRDTTENHGQTVRLVWQATRINRKLNFYAASMHAEAD